MKLTIIIFKERYSVMIGNDVSDYSIDKARHGLAARMLEDLEEGHFSFLADEAAVVKRYSRSNLDAAWQQFLRACRAYATLNGCLVLVDDTNKCFVDSVDIVGDYDFASMNEFAVCAATTYREKLLGSGKQGSVLLTVYRLPRANYEDIPWSHFSERGEYIGELRLKLS